jgi:hypothetical protein
VHTWNEVQPPGPPQAIDCPGTHASALASPTHAHAPYPVPSAVHTWLLTQPPGPTHPIDAPGTHARTAASVGAQTQGP